MGWAAALAPRAGRRDARSWTTLKLFGKLTFARGHPNVQRVYNDTRGDYGGALKLLEARGQDLQLEHGPRRRWQADG